MKKIRVLFPYVEAGYGHIMPMKSIEQTFAGKYGDRVEVISSRFFTETGKKPLIKYQKMMMDRVRTYNGHPFIGHFATLSCKVFGSFISSLCTIRIINPAAFREGVKHMRELKPDVVFSTHWATNYYAEHLKENKPATVMYCPDAQLNPLFEYHSDLSMISMPGGYKKALKKRKFNEKNIKLVPFLIRNEAFKVSTDKKEIRRKFGIPEDNFTVVLVEGGYGVGKMGAISELLIREHLPLTVIPICGKNKELYEHLKSLKPTKEVTFRPYGFTEEILELEAASDIFCGKSGNIFAEATFFGLPSIVTNCSNHIERNIANHYINTVGSSIMEFSPKKTVELIKQFAADPSMLEPYRKAAVAYHENFGSEKAADMLWEFITERFPELR